MPTALGRGLMQLDEVAGRVVQERLAAAAHGRRIAHVHAPAPELRDGRTEVVDEQCEVLAACCWRRRVDQVDLLVAGIEPGTIHAEIGGPVLPLRKPEDVDVEDKGGIDVVDVDGHVMDGERSHSTSLALPSDERPTQSPTPVIHRRRSR
jgi:hypothetical protein